MTTGGAYYNLQRGRPNFSRAQLIDRTTYVLFRGEESFVSSVKRRNSNTTESREQTNIYIYIYMCTVYFILVQSNTSKYSNGFP